MSRIYFFATGKDILVILKGLEDKYNIGYVEASRLAGPIARSWRRGADLPSVGYAAGDQEILGTPFLIMAAGTEVIIASGVMTDGETRYDVYQVNNPSSVLLRLGGLWKDGSLISGHFIASSNEEFPRKLMNALRKSMRGAFTKVGTFWVGPEALALLRSGTRLCTAIQSPPEYDLHEEPVQSSVR